MDIESTSECARNDRLWYLSWKWDSSQDETERGKKGSRIRNSFETEDQLWWIYLREQAGRTGLGLGAG